MVVGIFLLCCFATMRAAVSLSHSPDLSHVHQHNIPKKGRKLIYSIKCSTKIIPLLSLSSSLTHPEPHVVRLAQSLRSL